MTVEPDFWEVSWRFEGEEFEGLKAMGTEQQFAAQEVIFSQGDPADSMYLVLSGYALAVATDPGTDKERSLGIVAQGQSFGELGLLMGHIRTATVTAGTDITVLKITTETLKALEQSQPRSAAALYKKLARTLAIELVSRE